MGGLWGVGQGSAEEPYLIVVRYEPDGSTEADDLWAFVGKGITFDTGGISIKHGLDMYEMKTDMAGGAAVLGALRAIAQLRPQRRIVGIVPAAENMPSGRAIKPGDIVKTLAGYTIEVVDTDAEGRLVLVDGIAYARGLGAKRIVDLATLTGSIIVALGDHRTGLFSNDDLWARQIEAAAARAGEPVWRMPVSDDYKKRIESPIADFKKWGRPDATAAASCSANRRRNPLGAPRHRGHVLARRPAAARAQRIDGNGRPHPGRAGVRLSHTTIVPAARGCGRDDSSKMTFNQLLERWDWKPIRHCPGRFILSAANRLSPENVWDSRLCPRIPVTRRRSSGCHARWRRLISYQKQTSRRSYPTAGRLSAEALQSA